MSLDTRKAALLALVEEDRRRQRAALLEAADAQAAALRAQARAQAKSRTREALDAARERRDAALAAAQARRQTRERLARQGRASAALGAAWAALPGELLRRWQDPAARGAWLAHAMARAARELDGPGAHWRLRHAPGPTAGELAAATAAAPAVVDCTVDPALRAGLRIARDGNVLDASVDGLLSDRDAVASAVLRRLEDPA
jgi:hypothetical protein